MAYQPHKPPTESHQPPTFEELFESIVGSEEKSAQTHQQIIDLTIDSQPPQPIVDLTRSDDDDDNDDDNDDDEKKQPQKTQQDTANKYIQVLEIANDYRYKTIVSNLTKLIVGLYTSPDSAISLLQKYVYIYSEYKDFVTEFPVLTIAKISFQIPINQNHNIVGLKLEPVSVAIFMLKLFINDPDFKLLFVSNNNYMIDTIHDLLIKLSIGMEHLLAVSMSQKSHDKGSLTYGALAKANIIMVNVVKFVKYINNTRSEQQHHRLMNIVGANSFNIIFVCDAFEITERKDLVNKLFNCWITAGFDGALICVSKDKDGEEIERMQAVIQQFWMKQFE